MVFPADCPHVFRIFTDEALQRRSSTSTDKFLEEFPAYGSVLLRLALVNLRTVIVTAAVYWGFDHELRLS